jgi:hypothetical protein
LTTASTLKAPYFRRQQPVRTQGAYAYAQTTLPRRTFLFSARSKASEPAIEHPEETVQNSISLADRSKNVEKYISAIKSSPKVEPEEAVLHALSELEYIAKRAIAIRGGKPRGAKLNIRQSSASAILSLDVDEAAAEATPTETTSVKPTPQKEDDLPSPSHISRLAQDLLRDKKVFISPAVLKAYVNLQKLLAWPRAIPEALYLYATKPIPELGSSPPKLKPVNQKSYKQAIPADVAETALDAAIAAKDMPLAMTVIDLTYCAPAWKAYKWLTKFGPPATLVAITPFVLYLIASEISLYSGYLSPTLFKWYAFAGLCTYVGGTGILGWVALTTYNHHHLRVVWRPGMSLLDRWMREDERAALDKLAVAWGFKETWKMGDEVGEDWEGLRQTCFLRNMWLDKPDLMPGMNPPTTDEM